jgi:hypothetical protein
MGKRVYCEAESRRGGSGVLLICSKERGHDGEGSDPDEAVHYDATAREHFGYPGHLRIAIEIPGHPEVVLCESMPDSYGAMTEDQRLNYRADREEAVNSLMNIYSDYRYAPLPEEN